MNVPLFDSLSHPTLSGTWIDGKTGTTFAAVHEQAEAHGFAAVCAVGLHGVGGYEHRAFAEACAPYPLLVPIAGLDPQTTSLSAELQTIAGLGFRGVKIHPRFSDYQPDAQSLGTVLREVHAAGLVTMYCTYAHGPIRQYPPQDPLYVLVQALQRAPDARVVLMHGGDMRLMEYAQLVRHNPQLLLDLSFTVLKYRGSSMDMDIAYLLAHLDERLCIGVDHPDFDHSRLRARFDAMTTELDVEKARNVGYRNLARMLGVNLAVDDG